MLEACDFFNDCGKCNHNEKDFETCETDIWSGNCLQAFESEVVICENYFSKYQPDVKFRLDNSVKT